MVAATPRRRRTRPVGTGPCGSSSVSTQFPAGPWPPRLAPPQKRAPIRPRLHLPLPQPPPVETRLPSKHREAVLTHTHTHQYCIHTLCCLSSASDLSAVVSNAHRSFWCRTSKSRERLHCALLFVDGCCSVSHRSTVLSYFQCRVEVLCLLIHYLYF